ncbi:MAG: DUF1206 domain-containing protein [Planctomycetota bacterium]|nr:DUF1206 domain-containing protein [Planctomycetota bacterium]
MGSPESEQAKRERKRMELETKLELKRMKAEAKRVEKEAKLVQKYGPDAVARAKGEVPPPDAKGSKAVRYAETVRGVLYVLLGVSLVGALLLGQRNVITSFDDIVDSLFLATAGKVVLALIALAFVIYGLKYLRVVR